VETAAGADLDAAVALITDYALALPDVAATTITMHRLTQRVIRDDLTTSGQLFDVTGHAAALIEAAIPPNPQIRDAWPACAILLPHALAVLDPTGAPMRRLASIPVLPVDYSTAAAVWTTLTNAHIQTLGPEHRDTLTVRANLAYYTGEAGDAVAARDQYAVLLPIRERVSGPDHPDTLTARANLAYWTRQAARSDHGAA
jgi:hypothetical protein